MASYAFISSSEVDDLAEDLREVFTELASTLPEGHRAYTGECHPPLDVVETDAAVEVIMDLAGVSPDAVRILFKSGVLVIAGEKARRSAVRNPQAFHLIEREFGRFARGVRLSGAFDVTRSTAAIRHGELTIILPKRSERRGRAQRIEISAGPSEPGA